ncbi:hypothetical protein SBRY_10575 [Actinacidiphila bryophytorum]|uniref:DUF234 domain-containing protein n=1 Tax=Actinacidiphila bryophytorum TaxID=1436133 RepID=A0A9W4GXA5_9ACTN|nr:hypothetical protein SBRY_10575 [Actinacidiphila bryophytorum]
MPCYRRARAHWAPYVANVNVTDMFVSGMYGRPFHQRGREMVLGPLRRYRVTGPYLRFWLHLLGPYMGEIERGRGDLTLARIREGWTSWRGRAVEPLIREALGRILPDDRLPAAPAVGGYWTRTNDVEIDIVGADRAPIAKELLFVGSIE